MVFVNAPFAPLRNPSIGLSLLAAELADLDPEILYLHLELAARIGADLYEAIGFGFRSPSCMIGEWFFRGALFGDDDTLDRRYLEHLQRRDEPPVLTDRDVDSVLAARREVEPFLDWCCDEIERRSPRVVGLTSVFQAHVPSLALAERLKRRLPDCAVVFGGANCEGVMGLETVRRFDCVDAVVLGEADAIVRPLVESLLSGEAIEDLPGVYTRRTALEVAGRGAASAPRVADMDGLPYPDYGDFLRQWRASPVSRERDARLLFEASRGCWWGEKAHCTFCGLNGTSMAFRSKSCGRALAELEAIAALAPGAQIYVVDNILDARYLRDLIPALAEAGLGLDLFFEVKANLRRDQLELLRRAGTATIQPGIESFSDEVLGLMQKGVTGLQNMELLKWCAELDVWPRWYLLWGFPGEPPEAYDRAAELVPLLSHLPPPQGGGIIRLDRFSPNFERAEEMGFTDVEPFSDYHYVYPLPAEAVRNLAYFFTFAHADGRDVSSYVGRLETAIEEWKRCYPTSQLFYEDDGERLRIWDLRPATRSGLSAWRGWQRQLYLACRRSRPISWLAARVTAGDAGTSSAAAVERAVAPFFDAGLMVRDGDRLLSLAIASGSVDGEPASLPESTRRDAPGLGAAAG